LAETWDTLYVFKYDTVIPSYLSADITAQASIGTNVPITINTDGSDYIVKITIGNMILNQEMSYSGGNSYSYTWSINNNVPVGNYQVNITITDLAGNSKLYQTSISVVLISPGNLMFIIILIITITATIAGGATIFVVYRRKKKRDDSLKGKEITPSKGYMFKGKEHPAEFPVPDQTVISKPDIPHVDDIISKPSIISENNTKQLNMDKYIMPPNEPEDQKNEIITNEIPFEEIRDITPEQKTIPDISQTPIPFIPEKEIDLSKPELMEKDLEEKSIIIDLPKEEKSEPPEVSISSNIQDESSPPVIFQPKIEEMYVENLIPETESHDGPIEVGLPKEEENIEITEIKNIKDEIEEIPLKKLTKEEISNEMTSNLIPLIQHFEKEIVKKVKPDNPTIDRLHFWIEYLKAYPLSKLTLEDSKALSIDMVIWERIFLF